jgi:hypothetical protein
MGIAFSENRLCSKVHNPITMIAGASSMRRDENINTVDALGAVASRDGTTPTKVTVRSLKTISRKKLLCHKEVRLGQPTRETTSVCVVIYIHEKNNFVSSIFPF